MQTNQSVLNDSILLQPNNQIQQQHVPSPTTDFALLYYIRIVFYVIIVIKLIQIVFMRRRKLKISERIQRKFMYAHGIQMIKNFSAEEHELMNLTLQNTLKNAIQPLNSNSKKPVAKARKSVSFMVDSNVYYDPPQPKISSFSQISMSNARIDQSQIQQKKFEEESAPLMENKSGQQSQVKVST